MAAARLPNSQLLYLAPERTSQAQAWFSRAYTLGLHSQARLEIGLEADARRALLSQSLAHISWSETKYQSMAMLGALACGCSVITRPQGWLSQRVVPSVLITESQHQASFWLRSLMRHPAWDLHIGAVGARDMQMQHGVKCTSEQWLGLLAELVRR